MKLKLQKFIPLCTILIISSCFGVGKHTFTDANNYEQYIAEIDLASTFMPNISTLGSYHSMDVVYCRDNTVLLLESITLILSYKAIDYLDVKMSLLNKYTFMDDQIFDSMQNPIVMETTTIYEHYFIQIVDDNNFMYPTRFGLLGYSDDDFEIVYLYFQSDNITEIENLDLFIRNVFALS